MKNRILLKGAGMIIRIEMPGKAMRAAAHSPSITWLAIAFSGPNKNWDNFLYMYPNGQRDHKNGTVWRPY